MTGSQKWYQCKSVDRHQPWSTHGSTGCHQRDTGNFIVIIKLYIGYQHCHYCMCWGVLFQCKQPQQFYLSPVSWKYVLYYAKKKTKTRGIDTQKWTLAFICYAHFWRAYNTQFSRAYDTKFVGVHMIRSFRVHMIRIYTTTLTLPIA